MKDPTPGAGHARVIKTPEEIGAVRRASRASAAALREAMRSTRLALGERTSTHPHPQQRGRCRWSCLRADRRLGREQPRAVPALLLRRMWDGEVVLVDFAPEVDHHVSDVTRTWPVGGTFDERMVPIYDAVLAAQEAAIAAVPGAALLRHRARRHRRAARARLQLSPRHLPLGRDGGPRPGPDGGELSGMIFTIEPGIYDQETGIGVRIEDVVLVTEEGCEVLSADCPKTRVEIEALIAEEGILDVVDAKDALGEWLPLRTPTESSASADRDPCAFASTLLLLALLLGCFLPVAFLAPEPAHRPGDGQAHRSFQDDRRRGGAAAWRPARGRPARLSLGLALRVHRREAGGPSSSWACAGSTTRLIGCGSSSTRASSATWSTFAARTPSTCSRGRGLGGRRVTRASTARLLVLLAPAARHELRDRDARARAHVHRAGRREREALRVRTTSTRAWSVSAHRSSSVRIATAPSSSGVGARRAVGACVARSQSSAARARTSPSPTTRPTSRPVGAARPAGVSQALVAWAARGADPTLAASRPRRSGRARIPRPGAVRVRAPAVQPDSARVAPVRGRGSCGRNVSGSPFASPWPGSAWRRVPPQLPRPPRRQSASRSASGPGQARRGGGRAR